MIIDKKISGPYLTLKVKTEKIAEAAEPGQFVNIRVTETLDPLLRRPVSIADAVDGILTLIILIKGKGTRLLAEKKVGETLNIIGPLGNPFPEPGRTPLFIAGGIGAAPFLFLGKKHSGSTLLLGVRSKEFLPELEPFEKVCKIEIASDDGSVGTKGTVIDLLTKHEIPKHTIYACGPNPMFRALNKLFSNCPESEAYYSLETYMGCGFGACKGCTVETRSGDYKLTCTDGPVFPWNEALL